MKAIEIEQLKKRFGQNEVLKGLSLSVNNGEIFGYLGPNGAGKTTTIRCLLDFIRPSAGTIQLFGQTAATPEARIEVSYLSSENNLYGSWTGRQHIDYISSLRPIDHDRLKQLKADYGFNDGVKVRQLSTGNRQKLGIILAMMTKSKLLILDEPTRGLDPLLQNQFHNMLRQYRSGGGTVFMSSHNLAEVEELCDRVAIIRTGQIVSSETIESLKSKSLYQVRLVLTKAADTKFLAALGAENITKHGRVVHFRLRGQSGALVKALGKQNIEDLEITRATLEELFVELYQ